MKSATRLLWLDYWASKVDPNYKCSVIQYEKGKDGYWIVEAKLPFYDKVISEKSGKLIAAITNVARKACWEVDKLIAEKPELKVENIYVDGHWDIVVDKDGDGFTIVQSEDYSKEIDEIQKSLTDALSHHSEAILHTIKRWTGTTDLAYFHIFDKRLFGNDNKEIMNNMNKFLERFHKGPFSSRIFISDNSVIAFGFKMEIR